jgi:hypothetical protein
MILREVSSPQFKSFQIGINSIHSASGSQCSFVCGFLARSHRDDRYERDYVRDLHRSEDEEVQTLCAGHWGGEEPNALWIEEYECAAF